MRRRTFMVRLTFRGPDGEVDVASIDRRARTPQEAISLAVRAKKSSNPSARIEGASAFPYVVVR